MGDIGFGSGVIISSEGYILKQSCIEGNEKSSLELQYNLK